MFVELQTLRRLCALTRVNKFGDHKVINKELNKVLG